MKNLSTLTRISKTVDSFLFRQKETPIFLAQMRIVLGLVIAAFVFFGTDDTFYTSTSTFLFSSSSLIQMPLLLGGLNYSILKWLVIASSLGFAAGAGTQVCCWVLNVSFFFFNYYLSHFLQLPLVLSTHLNFFILIMLFNRSGDLFSIDSLLRKRTPMDSEFSSFSVSFMRSFIAFAYLSAATIKLVNSGPEWFLSGQTIYYAVLLHHLPLGLLLSHYHWVFPLMGIATGVFEFLFVTCLTGRFVGAWVSVAVLFHITSYFIFGILFFQFSFLIAPLFINFPQIFRRLQRAKTHFPWRVKPSRKGTVSLGASVDIGWSG